MKALVTGAKGFAGKHLVRHLRDAGWRVATLDRYGRADFIVDLTRDPLPRTSFDAVFHLAGQSNPAASLEDPRGAYHANTVGTARLVRDLRAGRFVLASSIQVYGDVSFVHESLRPAPRNPYAASKLCAEALAFASGKNVVVLRPSNHTGPGQSPHFVGPEIARQIALAEAGRATRVLRVKDLAPRVDLFDVRDMARAYLLAARRASAGEVYNVARGECIPIRRIVNLFLSWARIPLRVVSETGAPSERRIDSSKFRKATGWVPLIPLEQTLRDLLDHERRRVG